MVGSAPTGNNATVTRPMTTTTLPYDRFCDEVVAQAGQMAALLAGADLSVIVPTCPDWTLAQLVRHVGGNLRSLETAVRTQRAVTEPERQIPDHNGPAGDDPEPLAAWLTEAAAAGAATLRQAGPDAQAQVWQVRWPAAAWARRAANDLVIHRADAAGTVGAGFAVAPDLAADALDEFLDLMRAPEVAAANPGLADLRRPGQSMHLHATDPGPGRASEWLIELDGEVYTWRHAHADATVTVRGPVAEVLRVLYRRLPAGSPLVEVGGDRALLDLWLERVSLR
jgi:uncharacterized protein (TIGR03083 family)